MKDVYNLKRNHSALTTSAWLSLLRTITWIYVSVQMLSFILSQRLSSKSNNASIAHSLMGSPLKLTALLLQVKFWLWDVTGKSESKMRRVKQWKILPGIMVLSRRNLQPATCVLEQSFRSKKGHSTAVLWGLFHKETNFSRSTLFYFYIRKRSMEHLERVIRM